MDDVPTNSIQEGGARPQRVIEELGDSEIFHPSTVENTEQSVWMWNGKSGKLFLSPTAYNSDKTESAVSDWESLIHPDDLGYVKDLFYRHASGQEPIFNTKCRTRTQSGEDRWVMIRGRLVSSEEQWAGEPYDYIGTFTDITELQSMEQDLKISELRFRMLLENVNAAIFLMELDPDGNPKCFCAVNEAACHSLGYTSDEILKFSPKEIYPDTSEDFQPMIVEKVKKKESTFRTVYKAKNGLLIPVEINARYFVYGGVRYLLAAAKDLTDQLRAEEAAKKFSARKRRNALMNELIKGNLSIKKTVLEMAEEMGFKPQAPLNCYLLSVGEWRGKNREYWRERVEELRSLQDLVIEKLEDCPEWIPWVSAEGIGVLHFGNADVKDMQKYQLEFADRLKEEVESRIKTLKLKIGISEDFVDIGDLGARFRQCCIANELGGKIWPERKKYHYVGLGILQLFPYIQDRQQVAGYVERTLGKLLRYDRQKRDEYMVTLEAILDSDSLKDVAKKVYVHQKTVELRKRRIEEILGVSLTSFETRMSLSAALKMMKIFGINSDG